MSAHYSLLLLLLSIFFCIASALRADSKTLFYYAPNKHIGAAFIRQMQSDIARVKSQMASLINETLVAASQASTDEEREEARQLLRETSVEEHIMAALFGWNMEQVVNESCRRYEMEIDDACVTIDYDEATEKCRVDYNCKITEIAPGQRSASPISDDEAREKFEKSKMNK